MTLGLLAGAVEGFAVFQLLNHLTVVNDGFVMELVTGPEDYIAVVATAVMFTAGAMRGLRVRVTAVNGPDGPPTRSAAPTPN